MLQAKTAPFLVSKNSTESTNDHVPLWKSEFSSPESLGGGACDFDVTEVARRGSSRRFTIDDVVCPGGGAINVLSSGECLRLFDPEAYISHENEASDTKNFVAHDAIAAGWGVGSSFVVEKKSISYLIAVIKESLPASKPLVPFAIAYAKNQGWQKMDYVGRCAPLNMLAGDSRILDRYDFGNLIWGAAMCAMGVPPEIALTGAHWNSVRKHRQFDSAADQIAILLGYTVATANNFSSKVWA